MTTVPLPASVEDRVRLALERIRPSLQADGGDITLVEVDEGSGVVRVTLTGACEGCAASGLTLVVGVQRTVRELVPEIRSVEAV